MDNLKIRLNIIEILLTLFIEQVCTFVFARCPFSFQAPPDLYWTYGVPLSPLDARLKSIDLSASPVPVIKITSRPVFTAYTGEHTRNRANPMAPGRAFTSWPSLYDRVDL